MTNFANNTAEVDVADGKLKRPEVYSSSESLIGEEPLRFIKKSGHINVSHFNVDKKLMRFINDIFTTGVDLQWRWNLLVFGFAFLVTWVGFGFCYWLCLLFNGDVWPEADPAKYCIKNFDPNYQFWSTFLFSVETQTTIGFGYRYVTAQCPICMLLVVVQSVFGCVLDAFMIGLIMAKIMRPKKRAETLLYSRNAVINVRNGQLCFMFRVGNLRKSHLVEANIKMQYLQARTTREGEYLPLEQTDLEIDLNGDSDRLFLVTPQTICHKIDENSPLWDISAGDLETADFEIIVLLEGMVEATGMTTQARMSYLPSEIMWGHRFHNVISYQKSRGYKVNFKDFHLTFFTAECPTQSAKQLAELKEAKNVALKERSNQFSTASSGNDIRSTSSSSLENSNSDISNYDGQSSYV